MKKNVLLILGVSVLVIVVAFAASTGNHTHTKSLIICDNPSRCYGGPVGKVHNHTITSDLQYIYQNYNICKASQKKLKGTLNVTVQQMPLLGETVPVEYVDVPRDSMRCRRR